MPEDGERRDARRPAHPVEPAAGDADEGSEEDEEPRADGEEEDDDEPHRVGPARGPEREELRRQGEGERQEDGDAEGGVPRPGGAFSWRGARGSLSARSRGANAARGGRMRRSRCRRRGAGAGHGGDGVRRLGGGLAILLGGALVAVSAEKPAELILRNGKVVTMDAARPEATAIADLRGPDRRRRHRRRDRSPPRRRRRASIDLAGRTASPGFIDGHAHLVGIGDARIALDLRGARSWDEVVSRVAAAVKKARPGEWILGRGWHQKEWTSPPEPNVEGFPLHASLSAVSPANPVFLSHASGHAAFVNAAALEARRRRPRHEGPGRRRDPEGRLGRADGAPPRDRRGARRHGASRPTSRRGPRPR